MFSGEQRNACPTRGAYRLTVWCVLRKRSLLKSYKLQLRQLFKPSSKASGTNSLSLSKRRGSTACCQCRQWQSEVPQPSCLGISKSSPSLRACWVDQVNVLKNKTSFSESSELEHVDGLVGDRGGAVVKVLCYKSEGRWFDPRWCHWNFSLT